MYVIGLTGGIASGKSTAAETLRSLGAHVIDADAISRRLTSPGGAAADAILERFGTLDRKELGNTVFSNARARRDLNAIVHPMVKREMQREMDETEAPIVVLDIPLLFESGMETLCDEVWVVYVSRREQVRRVMARDGLSDMEALARIESQMPTQEKLALSDERIDTSGSFAKTREQIEALYTAAMEKAGVAPAPPPSNVIQFPTESKAEPELEPISIYSREYATKARAEPAPETHADVDFESEDELPPPDEDFSGYDIPVDETMLYQPRKARARIVQQRALESQASTPVLPHTRPFEDTIDEGAWEDTSTILEIPEEKSFFAKQKPVFWIIAIALLVVFVIVVGITFSNIFREGNEKRAEEQRLQQLAEEKARYKLLYPELIESYSDDYALDPAFVAAVIYNESRFDPAAVSYLGARGLMQVMPETGKWIAEMMGDVGSYTDDELFTPEYNIRLGTWYLRYLANMFENDIVKITASYHAGQNRVLSWLDNPEYSRDGKTLYAIPISETDQYVRRVLDAYEIYKRHYYPTETTAPDVSA